MPGIYDIQGYIGAWVVALSEADEHTLRECLFVLKELLARETLLKVEFESTLLCLDLVHQFFVCLETETFYGGQDALNLADSGLELFSLSAPTS